MQIINQTHQTPAKGSFRLAGPSFAWVCMLFLACALVLSLSFLPAPAYADSDPDSGDYSIESVSITADIQTDGSLHVVERRVIRFEEPRVGLCWWVDLPGGDSVETLREVSVAQMDSLGQQEVDLVPLKRISYDPSWRQGAVPKGNVYSFDAEHGRTYAFFNVSGEYVLMQSEYDIQGAVQLCKDCAELRWRFVAAGQWSSASSNVTCTVSLPVPAGVTPVAGEDVYGWCHGPEGGGMSFDAGVNSLTVWEEAVSADEYAEVRILLPPDWISNATPEVMTKHSGSLHRDSVLEEELEWVDQDAHRRLSILSSFIVFAVLSISLMAFALLMYVVFGRPRKAGAVRDGDLPGFVKGAHLPALSRLWRWNRKSPEDFASCIMGLVAKGVISIGSKDLDPAGDGSGPERVFFLAECDPGRRGDLDEVEQAAMRLIFDVAGGGAGSVWIDDLAQAGCTDAEGLALKLDSWHLLLDEEVSRLGYFESGGLFWQRLLTVVCAAYLIVAVVVSLALGDVWPAILSLMGCAAVIAIANNLGRRSAAGSLAYAKCQAVRDLLSAAAQGGSDDPGACHDDDSELAVSASGDASVQREAQGEGDLQGAGPTLPGEWSNLDQDRLLAFAYAIGAYELALRALASGLPQSIGCAHPDDGEPALARACKAGEGFLPACEQVAAAIAQVYDYASWINQRRRGRAAQPALADRFKAMRRDLTRRVGRIPSKRH